MVQAEATTDIDRRKSERSEVDEIAFISLPGSSTRCRMVNISSDGAAIDVPDASHIPDHFSLMTQRDRVVRNCRVAWIMENRIGVKFDVPPEEIPVRHQARQLLQYLRDGQWQRAASLPGGAKLKSKLLRNGWIESSGDGHELAYRITPKGLAAKTAPVRL